MTINQPSDFRIITEDNIKSLIVLWQHLYDDAAEEIVGPGNPIGKALVSLDRAINNGALAKNLEDELYSLIETERKLRRS